MALPFLDLIEKQTGSAKKGFGVRTSAYPILILGLALFVLSFLVMPSAVSFALQLALFMAPLWLPFLLVSGAWILWVMLKRSEFIASQKMILLEIKPPRNIAKTPLAMEAVLSGMHHGPGEGNWYAKYILGKVRPWWSLEIASLEGQIHFFIWTRTSFRRLIEAQFYAQYPGTQITEVTDYTRMLTATPEEWVIWGCNFAHTRPDPLPMKTYVEYGLDKVQKEYEQTDPLANLIEFMSTMGKGEYLWLQFAIRVHKGEKYNKKNAKGDTYTWKDEAMKMIQEIRAQTVGKVKYKDIFTGEMRETEGFPNPTKGQSEMMAAIERNVSKLAFDVGARGVYIAKPEKFDSVIISGLTGIFKQFSSEGWNGFKPSGWMTGFDDFPWEVGTDKLKNQYRTWLIEAYRRRQFFHAPFEESDTMVMSTEELATVFHIPSRAVETPSLGRVQSATGEAPANLPL